MCTIGSSIIKEELVNLDNMFEGDQKRDASDKVRGFIYQDYVALDFLIDENTDCICLEFLEDVDVFCTDGKLKYIQVKYYPKKKPVMKEIMTDMYYQYLRFDILGSEFEINPLIVIHRNEKVELPDLCKMKKYIETYSEEKPDFPTNPIKWLKDEIYILNKSRQKKRLFTEAAYEESIKEFLKTVNLNSGLNICEYQEELEEKLGELFKDEESLLEEDNRNKILFGLAINYVQKRYFLDTANFQKVRVRRVDFIQYMETNLKETNDMQIGAYLTSIINEHFADILLENPDIEEKQQSILDGIVKNTQKWFTELMSTIDGQFKLVNTLARDSYEKINKFKEQNVSKRLTSIIKCEDSITIFLDYLWKIMYNLCIEKENFDIKENTQMLDPRIYIDDSINNYICLKFDQDYVQTCSILPTARRGHFDRDLKNICSRMIKQKPQKWFMENAESGKYEYSYNTAHIVDADSITNVEDDSFYIECMQCIKVDQKMWHIPEICSDCIFAEKCKKGEHKK